MFVDVSEIARMKRVSVFQLFRTASYFTPRGRVEDPLSAAGAFPALAGFAVAFAFAAVGAALCPSWTPAFDFPSAAAFAGCLTYFVMPLAR